MQVHGIRVNAYAPGIVGTDMWKEIDTSLATEYGVAPGEVFKQKVEGITLGRSSVPDDVAKVVSFLAGKDSEYMTGASGLRRGLLRGFC